jgi:hypothetical protein
MQSGNAVTALLICLGAACATGPVFEPSDWSATIEPSGDSNVRANVRAAAAPGVTAISINLAGGDTNGTHPWHIHRGTCGDDQGIVGDPAAYTPLSPNSAGAASATANITVQLVPGENYMVSVHRSPDALGDIIGCAELR